MSLRAATHEICRGLLYKKSVLHEICEEYFPKVLVVERKLRHQRQQDMRGTDPTSVIPSPFRHKDLSLSLHSHLAWHHPPDATLHHLLGNPRVSTSIMFL